MKKSICYLVIVILLLVIAGEVTYLVVSKNHPSLNDQKNDSNLTLTDGVKLAHINKVDSKIIEEFDVILNGNKSTLTLQFTKDYSDQFQTYTNTGVFKNYLFMFQENKEDTFTIDNLKASFNENNFRLIKGLDNKNYLVVISNREVDHVLYILNDQLEVLNTENNDVYESYGDENLIGKGFMITPYYNTPCNFMSDINPWYENTFPVLNASFASVKIDDNKIYYLAAINKNESVILEERVYTINNNKLNYEVINKYQAREFCQEV